MHAGLTKVKELWVIRISVNIPNLAVSTTIAVTV